MKYIFPLIFALTFSIAAHGQVGAEYFVYDSTYRVGAPVPDGTLSASEGEIEFHFSSHSDYGDSISCNSKVIYSCNGVIDSANYVSLTKPTRKLTPGKYVFYFYINDKYREVATDTITVTAGNKIPLYVNFNQPAPVQFDLQQYMRYSNQEDKPVIYVYSERTQAVSIQLLLNGKMGYTYPAYNDGWNFTADPDGNLRMNGKMYPYLFWEGETNLDYASTNWNEGSIVLKDSLTEFFERTLAEMGMNEKEITDYITYWVPRMQKNDSCYIHFIMNEDYDQYAEMNISPKPDSKYQAFMVWTNAEGIPDRKLSPQHFKPMQRKGLTVVEWGGTELPYQPHIFEKFDQ
ncbi:MAG TPA: hypothetical protein VL651_01880 [Bacteroidia bacterium]|jgi:hypothetical protein|nr:hypothetical protein [Bacteroidia bacterium]